MNGVFKLEIGIVFNMFRIGRMRRVNPMAMVDVIGDNADDYLRREMRSDQITAGCSQIENKCARYIFFNSVNIIIGTREPGLHFSYNVKKFNHNFGSVIAIRNMLNIMASNTNQNVTCDTFSSLIRNICEIKHDLNGFLAIKPSLVPHEKIVGFIHAVTSFIFESGYSYNENIHSPNLFKFTRNQEGKYIYWHFSSEIILCGISSFNVLNFHKLFPIDNDILSSIDMVGIIYAVDKQIAKNVFLEEKKIHLGITNTKGMFQLETLEHPTQFNKQQVRTFLEKISDSFSASATSQDFSLSLSSIVKIKSKVLNVAVFKIKCVCDPLDIGKLHLFFRGISDFVFDGKIEIVSNSLTSFYKSIESGGVVASEFLHWVFDVQNEVFLCYRSPNEWNNWPTPNNIPLEKGMFIKELYKNFSIFIPCGELSFHCIKSYMEEKFLKRLIDTLLTDETPNLIIYGYIEQIVELTEDPYPEVFKDILKYLKAQHNESILNLTCCIVSNDDCKIANGNPFNIELIEKTPIEGIEKFVNRGFHWSIDAGTDDLKLLSFSSYVTDNDDLSAAGSRPVTPLSIATRMNLRNLLANTDRLLFLSSKLE